MCRLKTSSVRVRPTDSRSKSYSQLLSLGAMRITKQYGHSKGFPSAASFGRDGGWRVSSSFSPTEVVKDVSDGLASDISSIWTMFSFSGTDACVGGKLIVGAVVETKLGCESFCECSAKEPLALALAQSLVHYYCHVQSGWCFLTTFCDDAPYSGKIPCAE